MRRISLFGMLLLLLLTIHSAHAHRQLARSFYNITAIKTRALPNGVQITVETDGAANFGVDRQEFLRTVTVGSATRRTALSLTSFRLRFVGARSRIPAYNDVGSYPVDFAETTLGDDQLTGMPFFYSGRTDPSKTDPTLPRVDLRFHFYVPVKVQNFSLVYGEYYGWTLSYGGLQPREASITASADRRSVVITVISDRVETVRATTRPPRRGTPLVHRLSVVPAEGGNLRIDALHAPLEAVATQIARSTGTSLTVPAADAATDVTLFLPAASRASAIVALARASGTNLVALPLEAGGGFALSRGASGLGTVTERIPLHYLTPESARLLLPDFLLRSLRADPEHQALVAHGPPALIARIRADLARLDLPPPQVRVEAAVYEMTRAAADTLGLQANVNGGRPAFDTTAGSLSVGIQPGQKSTYAATLTALIATGQARLTGKPSLTLVSGDSGTLFAGQTRYLTVLQNDNSYGGGQNVQALQLPVGTSLTVTATTAAGIGDAPILLDLATTVATVDSIEVGTGLPTVGTRTVNATVRVEAGDTVVLGGLTLDDAGRQESRLHVPLLSWLFRSHAHSTDATELMVLVTATRLSSERLSSERLSPEGKS